MRQGCGLTSYRSLINSMMRRPVDTRPPTIFVAPFAIASPTGTPLSTPPHTAEQTNRITTHLRSFINPIPTKPPSISAWGHAPRLQWLTVYCHTPHRASSFRRDRWYLKHRLRPLLSGKRKAPARGASRGFGFRLGGTMTGEGTPPVTELYHPRSHRKITNCLISRLFCRMVNQSRNPLATLSVSIIRRGIQTEFCLFWQF
jgi:hypothetical protein